MREATSRDYAEWLATMEWTHMATIRTDYKMKPQQVNKFCNSLFKTNRGLETIFYTIERDKDLMANHAHLMLIHKDATLSNTQVNKLPFSVPYYEKIRSTTAVSNYTTKYIKQGIDYDILFREQLSYKQGSKFVNLTKDVYISGMKEKPVKNNEEWFEPIISRARSYEDITKHIEDADEMDINELLERLNESEGKELMWSIIDANGKTIFEQKQKISYLESKTEDRLPEKDLKTLDDYYTTQDLVARFGLSPENGDKTIRRWRDEGNLPQPIKIGRQVLWLKEDIHKRDEIKASE